MHLKNNLVVVDVETTGPNPFVHDLLSIAFVPVLSPERALNVFVRSTDLLWTEFARANFTRFSDDWNRLAVGPAEALTRIETYLEELLPHDSATLIGHNVGFDLAFLRKLAHLGGRTQFPHISHRAIDTHTLLYLAGLQHALPMDAVSSDAAFNFLGITPQAHQRHTALGDALATRAMFLHLLTLLDPQERETLHRSTR